MLKLMGKTKFTIFAENFCLFKPLLKDKEIITILWSVYDYLESRPTVNYLSKKKNCDITWAGRRLYPFTVTVFPVVHNNTPFHFWRSKCRVPTEIQKHNSMIFP